MARKRARDIMIPLDRYPHIPYWFTLRQAVAELELSEVEVDGRTSLPRALLVFDEKYELVGIVRRRDILGALEPRFMRPGSQRHEGQLFDIEMDPNLVDLSTDTALASIKEKAEKPVSTAMQPIVDTVDADDHLAKIIYVMINKDLNLLPVLEHDGVVGVVRSVDVFRQLAQMIL